MPIISASLDDESIESLDSVVSSLGLRGRSDAIRHSIRCATAELKEMDDFGDMVEGVLIVIHENHNNQWMNKIQYKYERIIKTQMHSHLQDRKCLEIMIITGDGESAVNMIKEIRSVGEAEYVKFVRS